MAKDGTNIPVSGMTDAHPINVKDSQYTFMLNGNIMTDISSAVTLTNEHSNYLCNELPAGFVVIGTMLVSVDNLVYLWLVNPLTNESQIGYLSEYSFTDVNDEYVPNNCDECVQKKQEATPLENTTQAVLCNYTPIVTDGPCCTLGFNLDFPIRKGVFKKDNCGDSIYFTDFLNPVRVLKLKPGTHLPDDTQRCVDHYTDPPCVEPVYDTDPTHVSCEALQLFPTVEHIHIEPTVVGQGGTLVAGTYQLAACYADQNGQRATRTFAASNPAAIFDTNRTVTDQVDYPTDKSIRFTISNLNNRDYKFIDIFIIGTVNNVSTVRQQSTVDISSMINGTLEYTLSDFEKGTPATIDDVLVPFPVYEKAQEISYAAGTLLLGNLTGPPDLDLQRAVIKLSPFVKWKTYECSEDLYADGAFAANYRTYLRDEVYPLGIVFERNNTLDTCAYPLIGRAPNSLVKAGYTYKGYWNSTTAYATGDLVISGSGTYVAIDANTASTPPSAHWITVTNGNWATYLDVWDTQIISNTDVISFPGCVPTTTNQRWQVYNTAINRGATCGYQPMGVQCKQKHDSLVCNSFTIALPTISFTATLGDFTAPTVVTGPSGSGDLFATADGLLVLTNVVGTFAIGDLISNSGATATGTVTYYITGTGNSLPLDCYTNLADIAVACAGNYPIDYTDPSIAPAGGHGCDPNAVPVTQNACTLNNNVRSALYAAGAGAAHPLCIDSTLALYNTLYNTGSNTLGVPYALLTGKDIIQVFPGGVNSYGKYTFLNLIHSIPDFVDPTPVLPSANSNCVPPSPFPQTWLWKNITLPVPPNNYLGANSNTILVTPNSSCIYYQTPQISPLMYFVGENLPAPVALGGVCAGKDADFTGDYWETGVNEWNVATAYLAGAIVFHLGLTYTAILPSVGVNPVGNPLTWGVGSTVNNNLYQSYWYNFYATSAASTLVVRVKLFDQFSALGIGTAFGPGDYRIDVFEGTPIGTPKYSTGDTTASYYYNGVGTPGDVDAGVLILGDVANSTGDSSAGAHGLVPPQTPLTAGAQYFVHVYLLAPGVAKLNVAAAQNVVALFPDHDCPCYFPNYAWANICINAPIAKTQVDIALPAEYKLACGYDIYYRQLEVPNQACEVAPFEEGNFAFWQSATKTYPTSQDNNGLPLWGELCGQPIRHFKFPDCLVTYLQNQDPLINGVLGAVTDYPYNAGRTARIYPIGLKIDTEDVKTWLDWAVTNGMITAAERKSITGYKIVRGNRATNKSIAAKGILMDMWKYNDYNWVTDEYSQYPTYFSNYPFNDISDTDPYLNVGGTPMSHPGGGTRGSRFAFHSPETSFNAPSIGVELKLEAGVFGGALGNFYQVQDHPKYALLSDSGIILATVLAALQTAADLLVVIGNAIGNQQYGLVDSVPVGGILVGVGEALGVAPNFFIYAQKWEELITNFGVPQNFAYYYAGVGNYHSSGTLGQIQNAGNKRRLILDGSYLIGGNLSLNEQGNQIKVNNYEREDSVYLHVDNVFTYSGPITDVALKDTSKFIMSGTPTYKRIANNAIADTACNLNDRKSQVASNYASMKYYLPDQYGSLQDIEWLFTGVAQVINDTDQHNSVCAVMLGGDEFIVRMTKYIKLPFFLDNPVGTLTGVDWQYHHLSNITNATYFFNSVGESTLNSSSIQFKTVEHNFDSCDVSGHVTPTKAHPKISMYLGGAMYLFSYGIVSFLCESDFNLNYRRCTNTTTTRGFYPYQSDIQNVTQEYLVPIETPNSYLYNRTYSRQNKENAFCTQPSIYSNAACITTYRNRVINSIPDTDSDFYRDNWKIFLGGDYFDFPLVNGVLNGLDGIERDKVMVRFANTTQVFNAFYTIDTNAGSAQLGTASLFANKPEEEVRVNVGYAGTESHAFISTPVGHFWVDTERHKVFQLGPSQKNAPNNPMPISDANDVFFRMNLPFAILQDFPTFNVDNPYKDVGIAMDWDYKYNRLFLTKLDYALLPKWKGQVTYIGGVFLFDGTPIALTDTTYFCNKSWTLSYSPALKAWISFHSFIPNYYIGHAKYLQTGVNFVRPGADRLGVWNHFISSKSYQVFYGTLYPFISDVIVQEQLYNKQLHSLEYQADFLRFQNDNDYYYNPDYTFNKMVIWSENQNSGNLTLVPQKTNDLSQTLLYPLIGTNSTTVLVTRKENSWRVNQFTDLVANKHNNVPPMVQGCSPYMREVNPAAMYYQKPTFQRQHMTSDYFTLRFINDKYSNYKIINKWFLNNTIKSTT